MPQQVKIIDAGSVTGLRPQIRIVAATLAILIALDIAVAVVLASVAPQSLVRFFDYGRSVPGKLAQWQNDPGMPGNLQDLAWRDPLLERSAAAFAAETSSAESPNAGDPGTEAAGIGPVVRGYGMSFSNQILTAAAQAMPAFRLDLHAGPAAPANFSFATFLDDRPNRREGDVVVLGIVASNLTALGSFSNRTWSFEQPAPYTYPVFRPDPEGPGLLREDPLVTSHAAERALAPEAAAAWRAQLRRDALHTHAAFALPVLDHSPFARLVRRALAIGAIGAGESRIRANPETGELPYAVILRRIVTEFAEVARADGQIPVVLLAQTRNPQDPRLLALLGGTLAEQGIAYVATEDHHDPRDLSGFISDGHYRPELNDVFARAFLALPDLDGF